jgi:hypothetical protein
MEVYDIRDGKYIFSVDLGIGLEQPSYVWQLSEPAP